jgi:putative heme degradation protein
LLLSRKHVLMCNPMIGEVIVLLPHTEARSETIGQYACTVLTEHAKLIVVPTVDLHRLPEPLV